MPIHEQRLAAIRNLASTLAMCVSRSGTTLQRGRIKVLTRSGKAAMAVKTSMALMLGLALAFASQVSAQDDAWPTRTVRLVAPAGPGGNPDVMARLLADKFTAAFGKPFIVENVPGAGGVVAANAVAKAPPDGHMLMFGDSGALAINPALTPGLGYDPIKDFTPVTALVTLPTILVTHPDVQAKTLGEFIALAKKQPGQMSFGSAG